MMQRYRFTRAIQRSDRVGFFKAWKIAGVITDSLAMPIGKAPPTLAIVALLGAPCFARAIRDAQENVRVIANNAPPGEP